MKKLLLVLALFVAQLSYAQWEPDVRLTNNPDTSKTSYNYAKCIAAIDNFVHVVWYDKRDGNYEIYYKRSIDKGVSWEADNRLTYDIAFSAGQSIAVSGTDIHVVWNDNRDGNSEIYYKQSIDGGSSWGSDTRLTEDTASSYQPSISVSGACVQVVWTDLRDGPHEIYYKRSLDGGMSWQPDIRLNYDDNHSYNPSIATSGTDTHIVWNDFRDGPNGIYYNHSDDMGESWYSDLPLTNGTAASNLASIAVSGTNVHVAWMDYRDGDDSEIYYKRSINGGASWEEALRLTKDELGYSMCPNLDVSSQVVHLVWEDTREGNYSIYYKRSENAGFSWGLDTLLSDNWGWNSRRSSISTADSVVHVVWYDSRDLNYEIYYKRNPTGGTMVGLENELTGNTNQPISFYPNPASSIINVHIIDNPIGKSLLVIRNILGETVVSKQIQTNELIVDVSTLLNGLYFVEVIMPKKRTEIQKLIICK